MWFTVMALEVALTHTLQTLANVSQAEWVVIMIYLVFSIFVSYCIVQAYPTDKLTVPRPSARIFGPLFLSRMVWHCLIYVGLSVAAWMVLIKKPWYMACDQIRDIGGEFTKVPYTARAGDFRSEMYTFIVLWHLIITAFALSFGGIFRRKVFRNIWIWGCLFFFCAFVLCLLWSGPNGFSCTFFAQCDVPTMLATTPVVIKQLSTEGSVGGCFYGAQICREHNRLVKAGVAFQKPTPENHCTYNPNGLMPFNTTNGFRNRWFSFRQAREKDAFLSQITSIGKGSQLNMLSRPDIVHPLFGPLPEKGLGRSSLRGRDARFANSFIQNMFNNYNGPKLSTKPADQHFKDLRAHDPTHTNGITDMLVSSNLVDSVDTHLIGRDPPGNQLMNLNQRAIPKSMDPRSYTSTTSHAPTAQMAPKNRGEATFSPWKGKYFAQFKIGSGNPIQYNIYYQIDEYGTNMLSGFEDQKLEFRQLKPSTNDAYPASKGWYTFQSAMRSTYAT